MNRLSQFLEQIAQNPNGAPLTKALEQPIELNTIGPVPLSRMTDLGDSGQPTGFDSGELRLELTNLKSPPLRIAHITATTGPDGKTGTAAVTIAPTTLSGAYRLFAVHQPKVDLDTGGNLMSLAAVPNSGNQPSLTVQQLDQLQQADQQRTKLKTTANGQRLLSTYNKYNDDYNQVFQTNRRLRYYWSLNGTTSAMADHTSQALSKNEVVNPDKKTRVFGKKGMAYNENAFLQQTLLAAACHAANLKDAAQATFHFSKQVTHQTGDSMAKTVPQKADAVYKTVNQTSTDLSAQPHAEAQALADAFLMVARKQHNSRHLTLIKGHGYDLSPEMMQAVQEVYAEGVRQQQPADQATLWRGGLQATLPENGLTFTFARHPDNVVSTTMEKHNPFNIQLQMDDSAWTGKAGDLARQRLSNIRFLHSLVNARITNFLERAVEARVSKYMAEGA